MQRATGERQIPELRGGISLRCNNGLSAAAPRGWAGFSAIFMDGRADEKMDGVGMETTGNDGQASLAKPWAAMSGRQGRGD
jgi:hypothetical protein